MRFGDPPPQYSQEYMLRLIGQLNHLDQTLRRKDVTLSRLNIADLPTSATGLVVGDLWNDAGTVKVKT